LPKLPRSWLPLQVVDLLGWGLGLLKACTCHSRSHACSECKSKPKPSVRCFPKVSLPALGHSTGCSVDTGAVSRERRFVVNDVPAFSTEDTNDGPYVLIVFTRTLCPRWKPLPTGVVRIVTILP